MKIPPPPTEHDLNEIERGQLCQTTIESLYEATGGLRSFPGLLKKIIANKAWERRINRGRVIELKSLRELITEQPLDGWGEDPKKVEAVIKDDPEALAMFREAMNGVLLPNGGDRKTEGSPVHREAITLSDSERNSNAYWQARIQRDCPEELEAIKAGDKRIIDVRKERGWVPKSKRVTLTGNWSVDRQRLVDAFGEEYVEGLES